MKTSEFKFGQLITVDDVVYRCQKTDYPHECEYCDIEIDFIHGQIGKKQKERICIRC